MGKKVGVVGAGLMGVEIALVFALAGHQVLLSDRDEASVKRALTRLRELMQKGASRSLFAADQIEPVLARIAPAANLGDFADREFVTEAVFESVEVKTTLLGQLDEILAVGCVLASNTSTIPISTLASALSERRRPSFIGTHYFSPVSRMKLVEVIPSFETASSTVDAVTDLMNEIGKTPIKVKDVAGFAVNRMLHAFLIEAVKLVEEGVATPEDLDTACRLGLGHPIGPFALMDVVTSGLCVQAQEIMQEAYGERFRPPALIKQRVRAGYNGGKGRPGWLAASGG